MVIRREQRQPRDAGPVAGIAVRPPRRRNMDNRLAHCGRSVMATGATPRDAAMREAGGLPRRRRMADLTRLRGWNVRRRLTNRIGSRISTVVAVGA